MSEKIFGAHLIVKSLEQEGIEVVFGIPGLYNMPIFDALYRHPKIKVITVRHEQGAAFMADGYARATGKPAAVLLLPGPGITNAMTGIGEAFSDSSPMLVLASQVNREFIDKDAGLLHEMTGQFEMLAHLTKYGARIENIQDIPAVFNQAVSEARSGRPRPVQVEIPRDVQVEAVSLSEIELPEPAKLERLVPADELVDRAVNWFAESEKPLIIAGGGVVSSEASKALIQLAEYLGAPVLTTGMGVTSIPGDHPLACGVSWVAAADMRPLVAASDLVLAVGTRFNEGMTQGWNLPMPEKSIRIDIDPDEIQRNIPAALHIVGDAKITLEVLGQKLRDQGVNRNAQMHPEMVQARKEFRIALDKKVGSTRPWMEVLRQVLPRESIISADMSLFWADMLGAFPMYEPRTMLFPWGFGTLGFAVPEAIGAKIARPDTPVVAICGDGAFLFTGTDLATAVQYGVNIPIILPNNQAYGMIKVQQRDQFDEQFMAVDLANPDFVRLAESFGAYGKQVTTPAAFGETLQAALEADRPTLIEIPWAWTWGSEG